MSSPRTWLVVRFFQINLFFHMLMLIYLFGLSFLKFNGNANFRCKLIIRCEGIRGVFLAKKKTWRNRPSLRLKHQGRCCYPINIPPKYFLTSGVTKSVIGGLSKPISDQRKWKLCLHNLYYYCIMFLLLFLYYSIINCIRHQIYTSMTSVTCDPRDSRERPLAVSQQEQILCYIFRPIGNEKKRQDDIHTYTTCAKIFALFINKKVDSEGLALWFSTF